MTPRELLALDAVRTDTYDDGVAVEIRYFKEHHHDFKRDWVLAAVYVKGKPVAILQCAGRHGGDHTEHYVLDQKGYKRFLAELELADWSFFLYGRYALGTTTRVFEIEMDETLGERELTSWNSCRGNKLTTYYGYTLDGHFDRY